MRNRRPQRSSPLATALLTTLAAVMVSAALAPPCAAVDCPVVVTVTADGGQPVPGARVTLLPGEVRRVTGEDGTACLSAPPAGGGHVLVVADGFMVAEAPVAAGGGPYRLELRAAFADQLVVSATARPTSRRRLPVDLEVIDRASLERSAARTLAEAVEWTPGVQVESGCQNCNVSAVRMLGLQGPYTQLLVDGLPTVSSLASVYGLEQLPSRLIDSVEVVRGGGSPTYGAGAVAGVIDLITHQASASGAEAEVRLATTDGGIGGTAAAVADRASADGSRGLTLFAQADEVTPVDRDGDGFTEVSRRSLVVGGLGWDGAALAGAGRFGVDLNVTDEARRGGDRLALPPHEAEIAEAIDSHRVAAGLTWLHTPAPSLDYRLAASWADTRRESYYGTGRDPDAYGSSDNPLVAGDARLDWRRHDNTLSVGVQLGRDRLRDAQPGYGRALAESYETLGLYLQDDRRVGRGVTLLYGIRVDRHSELAEPVVSPRAAVAWSPRPELTVRASLGRGFRPPVVFDEDLHITLVGGGETRVVRNHPELAEERSTSTLLEAVWQPTLGERAIASLGVSLFNTELDGLFEQRPEDDPATREIEITRVNQGTAQVRGVELAAGLRHELAGGGRLAVDLSVTRQESHSSLPDPEFGSREMLRTPRAHAVATVAWSRPGGLDLFVGARYGGSMKVPHYAGFIPEDRLETTPSFLTLDLNGSLPLRRGGAGQAALELLAGVRNVTDAYQEDLDRGVLRDATYVYGPRFPRTWSLGLRVRR